jgi:hypothetical protein
MSIKKNAPVQRLGDEAVNAAVDPIYGRFQRLRTKTVSASQRKKNEADAKRNRATYDITAEMEASIATIAREESLPKSQVAQALLTEGLRRFYQDYVELVKKPSRSPMYDWVLEPMELPKRGGGNE